MLDVCRLAFEFQLWDLCVGMKLQTDKVPQLPANQIRPESSSGTRGALKSGLQ